ncbi:Serine/threonine-protein phosphatase 2A activator 1 [Xylographa soralifera]|nr:Serine/threonine-protein phosphatase 2A activator 1 [Xylographa soralifera]
MASHLDCDRFSLERLDGSIQHKFIIPVKKINTGQDVTTFLVSRAYHDLITFLMQLNKSMFPHHPKGSRSDQRTTQALETNTPVVTFSATILQLQGLIHTLGEIIDEVPLDTGPRRFGNVSFRRWHAHIESRGDALLRQFLPLQVCSFNHEPDSDPLLELRAYFLGSFGSSQRLDYGTGHELSFLAFLACIWKLGGFPSSGPGSVEREIVLGLIEPYLALIRRLILTYTLEPAGSHGVWGLDDHSFLPYVFGSAQYGPPITDSDQVPTEGSLVGSPDPASVTKAAFVERERKTNMYFGAIGFIYDVKKGPFWEHSPTLYDISGVRTGWAKINKGMIKMYNVEVLSKFPVVQHFPFGSLFSWDRDANAIEPPTSVHSSSQPTRESAASVSISSASMRYPVQEGTQAPWASSRMNHSETIGGIQAPWASGQPSSIAANPRPIESGSRLVRRAGPPPFGSIETAANHINMPLMQPAGQAINDTDSDIASTPQPTKAPWAK